MPVCDECFNFKAFGKKCWFFWEEKKTCSQHRTAPDQEPSYRSVEMRL